MQKKLSVGLVRLLNRTVKIKLIGVPADDFRCVFAFWHRNLLMMMMHRIGSGIVILVSTSDAGEVVAGPASELGYIPVRGSTTRRGSRALINLIRLSADHSIAITPDGPFGPVGVIQPGIFQLATLAKIPIVPVTAVCNREWIMNSWDQFRLPKLFSRISITYGEPIWVNTRDDFATAEDKLRQALIDIP